MYFLKRFSTESEYQGYIGNNPLLPNVSHVIDSNIVFYNLVSSGNFFTLKFEVDDVSVTHTLFGPVVDVSTIDCMVVDGAVVPASGTYVFNETGEHTVVVHLKDSLDNLERYFYGGTFVECDLTHVNADAITSLYATFYNCFSVRKITLPQNFAPNNTSLYATFYKNYYLTDINLDAMDTSNVTTMYGTFYACESFPELDLSAWDTSNVTDMGLMFYMCGKLVKVTMTNDVSKMANVANMFKYTAGGNADSTYFGSFYYNPEYDYTTILGALPTDWTPYQIQ